MQPAPHITELYIENVKKLRAVRITPDGSVVQICGPNGSGKSSVLDALYWALAGKSSIDPEPVRRGEESATIRLSLGEVIVTRTFDAKSGETKLKVEAASGATFPSPQRLLDDLLGASALSFDPLAFDRMKPKEQLLELRKVVRLPDEVAAWEADIAASFARRTEVNRRLRDREGEAQNLPRPSVDAASAVRPDLDGLLARLNNLVAHNEQVSRSQRERNGKRVEAEDLLESAAKMLAESERLIKEAQRVTEEATGQLAFLDALPALPPLEDAAAVSKQIEEARTLNAAIDQAERWRKVDAGVKELRAESEQLTKAIEAAQGLISLAVSQTPMPVEGLAFGDEGVLYNGLPLEQASSAERLRVSLAIAMAAAPKLKVLRIKDGSLLDEKSLALVAELAQERGYQVWIERVDTSGKVGIIMEDGEARLPEPVSTDPHVAAGR